MFNASTSREHRGSVTDIIRTMEAEEQKEEKHVLVVDDDNISRTVLSKMLEQLNFRGMHAYCVSLLILLHQYCSKM